MYEATGHAVPFLIRILDAPTADGTVRRVMFGLDDPETVTVYLYAARN